MTNEPVEFEKIETTDEVKAEKPKKVKDSEKPRYSERYNALQEE